MIELPDWPAPNGADPVLIDFGFFQRPASGAASLRIDRPGSRFRVAITFPPMKPDVARKFLARLLRAKRQGLRIEYPLLGVSQGYPGSPVVDGAGQAGTSLDIRGLTPHYGMKEGYWLTLIGSDGVRYLHCSQTSAIANAGGQLAIEIEPPLRAPFPDGAAILLAHPTIEGVMPEELGWSLSIDQLVRGGTIVIEEAE